MEREGVIAILEEKLAGAQPKELARALEELNLSVRESPEESAQEIYSALVENGTYLTDWDEKDLKATSLPELLINSSRTPTLD